MHNKIYAKSEIILIIDVLCLRKGWGRQEYGRLLSNILDELVSMRIIYVELIKLFLFFQEIGLAYAIQNYGRRR